MNNKTSLFGLVLEFLILLVVLVTNISTGKNFFSILENIL